MTPFDDLELLRVFCRIVESGSMSAAARSLKVPQPSVSRYLRSLEERAGARLLQRDTHRLHLTETGRYILDRGRTLLDLAEAATDDLRREKDAIQGHVRVFTSIDSGQTFVARLLALFLQTHPAVTVELSYTNRPVQMIEDGYDLGIVAGQLTDDRLVARPLASLARRLLASPALSRRMRAPKVPQDLESWPWAALSGHQFGGGPTAITLQSRSATRTVRLRPRFVAEGVTALREVVCTGVAAAVLPDWLTGDDLAAGRLLQVLPGWLPPPVPLNLLYTSDRQRPARVAALIAFVEAHLLPATTPAIPPP